MGLASFLLLAPSRCGSRVIWGGRLPIFDSKSGPAPAAQGLWFAVEEYELELLLVLVEDSLQTFFFVLFFAFSIWSAFSRFNLSASCLR